MVYARNRAVSQLPTVADPWTVVWARVLQVTVVLLAVRHATVVDGSSGSMRRAQIRSLCDEWAPCLVALPVAPIRATAPPQSAIGTPEEAEGLLVPHWRSSLRLYLKISQIVLRDQVCRGLFICRDEARLVSGVLPNSCSRAHLHGCPSLKYHCSGPNPPVRSGPQPAGTRRDCLSSTHQDSLRESRIDPGVSGNVEQHESWLERLCPEPEVSPSHARHASGLLPTDCVLKERMFLYDTTQCKIWSRFSIVITTVSPARNSPSKSTLHPAAAPYTPTVW